MMGKVWRLLLLALLLNASLATMALARAVYLADGGIIQAQKVWKEEGRIYVLLNRDSLITFSPEEINLKKTFAKKWKNAPLKSGYKSVTKAVTASAAPAAPAVAGAATPAVAVPAAKAPAAVQASPPPPAAAPVAVSVPVPAKTTPPPPAVAKPAPAPRPAAAPVPTTEAPKMLGLGILGAGLLFILLLIASFWKVFEKAGEAGWKSLIPIYNLFVLLRIAGCPSWWFLMFLLPVVNIYFMVVMHIRLAERFGKSPLFGFALCFFGFIFFPVLAFGSAFYEGEESFTFDEG
jgi:hypothetical protein